NQLDFAASVQNLGLILWEEGRLQDAENSLLESLDRTRRLLAPPYYAGLCCMNLGLVQRELGNLDEAERLFREGMRGIPEGHPNARLAVSHLATALRRRASLPDHSAIQVADLRQALQLDPGSPFTADALAAAYAYPALKSLYLAGTPVKWRFTTLAPPNDW